MKIDFTLQDLDFVRQDNLGTCEIKFTRKETDNLSSCIEILLEENVVKCYTLLDGNSFPLELSFAEVMALSKELEELIDEGE